MIFERIIFRKRKNINKERAKANDFGQIEILTGKEIKKIIGTTFGIFIKTRQKKWGTPYLTRQFFDQIHETMRSKILLILARKEGKYIAGALNFIGSILFWSILGCLEDYPFAFRDLLLQSY